MCSLLVLLGLFMFSGLIMLIVLIDDRICLNFVDCWRFLGVLCDGRMFLSGSVSG